MQAMNPLKSSFALIESISQKELSLGNPNSNSFFSKTKSMLKPILTLSNIIRNQEHTPLSRTTSFKSVESDSSTTGSFSTPKRKSYDCVLKDSMRELVGERCNNAKDRNQGQSSEVDTLTTSKLELFIVCRFGKLSSEDQNLLRIASIIGLSFSSEILFGLLSPKMRYQMETSVQSLKEKSWILDSIEEDGEYVFVHPLFHQTLYDLTPAGDRAKLHASVASFILEVHDEDPTYFSQLGHHYSLSVESRPKAFEYFVRASIFSIVKGPNYCESGLKLLSHARSFADGAVDCECALGIIEEQRNKIIALKMEMIKTETGTPNNVKTPISTSKAIFNFRNLRVTPKSAEDQDNMCQTHQMTSDELAAIQDLFEAAELEYHEAYEEYMNQNVVGVAVKWQLPFTKRFDSHKKGRRRSTLYRKNSIWDLRIEDISSEFAKIRKSFLRRQSLRRESMNKLAEEIKTKDCDDDKVKLSDKAKNALADEVGEEEGGGGGGEHEAIDNDDVKNDEKDKRVIKKKRQNVDRRRSSFLDSILSRKPSAGIVRKPTPESLTDGGGRTTHSCLIS